MVDIASIVVAGFAFAGSILATVISIRGDKKITQLEAEISESQEATEFVDDKLTNLYVPISMHLAATNGLFDRFFEPNTTDAEKTAIEHEMHHHNAEIRDRLMKWSIYLEPPHPDDSVDIDELSVELLEHLIQWETVYKLKYEYEVYDGPVFAGISDFGFRGFPDGVDDYFNDTTRRLREKLHHQRSTISFRAGMDPMPRLESEPSVD